MSNCPVCQHGESQTIIDELTRGTAMVKIAQRFRLTQDDLVMHIEHGSDGSVESDDVIERLLSQSEDEFSILKYNLLHLRNRYTNLILAEAASAESKELISLSRAINDTVKTMLITRKEIGQVDDTRSTELEKMFNELMMTLPMLCAKDQAIIERTLGITTIVE